MTGTEKKKVDVLMETMFKNGGRRFIKIPVFGNKTVASCGKLTAKKSKTPDVFDINCSYKMAGLRIEKPFQLRYYSFPVNKIPRI
jgi:hypothetical protein